jgi:hypothetical protein
MKIKSNSKIKGIKNDFINILYDWRSSWCHTGLNRYITHLNLCDMVSCSEVHMPWPNELVCMYGTFVGNNYQLKSWRSSWCHTGLNRYITHLNLCDIVSCSVRPLGIIHARLLYVRQHANLERGSLGSWELCSGFDDYKEPVLCRSHLPEGNGIFISPGDFDSFLFSKVHKFPIPG